MKKNTNRRDFIATSIFAGTGTLFFPGIILSRRSQANDLVRLGLIGVGLRGTSHLKMVLRREDVEVNAICDIDKKAAKRAVEIVRTSRGKEPAVYTAGDEDFLNLVKRDDLDGVIISTPWRWHAPMAIATMKAAKYAGLEVPAIVTLDEAWDLVKTFESTGSHCMLLENVCYRRDVMAVLNMVRRGLFGELIHCHCGYQHDVRGIKFNDGKQPPGRGVEFGEKGVNEAKWRTQHSIDRNGDIYPTHGVGPVATMLNINRGNRFISLTSTATKSRGLHNYVVEHGGPGHPNAKIKFKLGDIVTTVIKCANGETVVVSHDTNLPRPYSLNYRIQGTKGLWMKDNDSIYLEGKSPESHQWEPFEPYGKRYDHPLWKKYERDAEGAGHGGMDFFIMHAFLESVKRNGAPPIDVYDAVIWSAISPLSEMSIANGSNSVDFPDFTHGSWKANKPIFGLTDDY